MTWEATTEVGRFLAHAGSFLDADPVANNVLLTEARFWSRLSSPAPGARFGWWIEGEEVSAAFVQIPDHATVCSPLPASSAASLPPVLANASHLGVQAGDVAAVTASWRAHSQVLTPRARLTLLRLDQLRARALPEGIARRAGASDLPLLRSWFSLFQQRHPDDFSHVEFVVDQPLADGGVLVWEVEGRPMAMASRTPRTAGMVRMGLAFQPTEGTTYADAAFDVACEEAARIADHVLVLSGTDESTATLTFRGFAPVLDRVVLEVLDAMGERPAKA